jgi:hypothetical protein
MAVITTGNHPKALWPGVKAWFGASYNEIPLQHTEVFSVETSDKAYEEDVEMTGFGLAPVKSEGGSISYDSHTQGPTTRYTNVVYGLGYIVTEEEIEDNKYEKVSKARARALARSMRQTKEIVGSNVFNRAFTAAYAGGDGQELIANAHPTVNGTQSNYLATPADLSEASLEDMFIMIMNATDTRGLRIRLMPRKLIVPSNLAFEAERIVKSNLQNDTANNAINAIKSKGLLPEGVMTWQYLTDTDAWFVKTDAPDGLKLYNRRALSFDKDADFDTSNAKAKATERYVFGWSDWRAVYGSEGAA